MKVNLGSGEHKKTYLPFSFDSSTSQNFGEVIPIFCKSLVPNSHVKIDVRDAVRFAPLSFPTFGKAYLKNYFFRFRMSDLYAPFDNMLSQTPFTGASNTYIPTSVPSVPLWFLWLSVLSNSTFTIYSADLSDVTSFDQFKTGRVPFSQILNLYSNHNTDSKRILSSDLVSYNLPYFLLQTLLSSVYIDSENTKLLFPRITDSNMTLVNSYFFNKLGSADTFGDNIFSDSSFSNNGSVFASGTINQSGDSRDVVTFGSADYIFPLTRKPSLFLTYSGSGSSRAVRTDSIGGDTSDDIYKDLVVCIRLNDSGKLLRKILMGLGYQITPSSESVSLLPLYAYFKAYFDTFAPKRYVQFSQTHFYQLINFCVNTGSSVLGCITNTSVSGTLLPKYFSWSYIIDDLLSCFYTKDTDYYSAQINGLINNYGDNLKQDYTAVSIDGDTIARDTLSSDVDGMTPPRLVLDGRNNLAHTQSQQNILSRLSQFVNRRSLAGGKVASLLKSVFGINVPDIDKPFVGSSSLDINFSDVFSTAETAEGSLGEYAGKALAFTDPSRPNHFSCDVDTHSLLICLSVVVPRTQYVQGVEPSLFDVSYDSFYNPLFDGLTLLNTHRSSFYAGGLFNVSLGNSFGYAPIYAHYKTDTQGVLNGDLSLRSTKSTYDSFTMDELFASSDSVDYIGSTLYKGTFSFIDYDLDKLSAGTMWRYLGRWLWLGRFDRIFVNNRLSYSDWLSTIFPYVSSNLYSSSRNLFRSDDNLICHHVVNLEVNAPVIPLKGSYMTNDLNNLDPSGLEIQGE